MKLKLIFLLVLCGVSAGVWAFDSEKPIEVSADRSELDTQQETTRLLGNVRIDQDSLTIIADEATFFRADGSTSRIEMRGTPVKVKQTETQDDPGFDAEALMVDYMVDDGQVILRDEVVLRQTDTVIRSDRVTFDLDENKVLGGQSAGSSNGRVNMQFSPKKSTDSPDQ